jgi:CheY-like chemotaxis protein
MSKRILVVEDQPDIRQIIRDMLDSASGDRVNHYGFIAGHPGGGSTGRSVSGWWSAIHLSACSASSNHARAIPRRVSLFFMSAVFAAISVQCAACSL